MAILKGIDISNWQRGFSLANTKPDFVIVKATEGLNFTDKCCDGFVQDAITLNIPFGYYHFARSNDAEKEATYFYNQTKGYVGKGIPILDFEVLNSNTWLETWCKTFYQLSGVKPWVYMNSDYINNRGYGTTWIKANCGLWLAGYPKAYTSYPDSSCPYGYAGWTLAAWQFTSSLAMGGMNVDGNFFYGDRGAWSAYAGSSNSSNTGNSFDNMVSDSALDLATKVIKGEYGTGADRKSALGSRYEEVQAKVNDLYAKANKAINGTYGNGTARKNALGSEYDIVQYIVNNMLTNGIGNTSVLELATKVIKGEYGTGADRKSALGSRYEEVQAKVNDLYAKANKAINGTYGNGTARKNALGSEYDIVQYIVNNMLN